MKINKFLNKISKIRIFLALILLGSLFGILIANLFQHSYFTVLKEFEENFILGLNSIAINKTELFYIVVWKRIKTFLFLWLFSFTILGVPYMMAFSVYKGFSISFMLYFFFQSYGGKGVAIFLVYYFPQCLIFAPVMLFTMVRCREFSNAWNDYPSFQNAGRKRLVREQIPIFMLLLLMIILGCFLEAYFNSSLLKIIL